MPLNVFVCDDVEPLRVLLRLTFEDDPGKPPIAVSGEAGDGAAAVSEIRRSHPDVVVLDLSMPGTDGLEAIPMIKEASPETKIVVFSGFEAARAEQTARDLGADDYVEKGVPLSELVERVRRVADETA